LEEGVPTSTFSVSGLSTGMDTSSMIDKLVSIEQQPLTALQTQQSACKSQVSILGNLASKLSALQDAADALGTGGVLGLKATSANTAFAATPGTGAIAGSYTVQVTSLATAAKERSTGFAQGAKLQAGSMTLDVDGKAYGNAKDADGNPIVTWAKDASLADVASAIRASGAPVSATVLFDGQNSYLSITKLATGYVPDGSPDDGGASQALVVTDHSNQLGMAPLKDAGGNDLLPTNAKFSIDGLAFTRPSNAVSDALPGTTLRLNAQGGPAEGLTVEDDADATQQKLQTFVTAYNAVMAVVQQQLDASQTTNRTTTLAGDTTISRLQRSLQSITSSIVGSGSVRALADLGVKTQRDGSLTIDADVLSSAIARDPGAVDAIFTDKGSGIAKLTSRLVDGYTAPSNGLISIRQSGLQKQISQMDDRAAQMQARLDTYRQILVDQFTAMEKIVGQYKSIGTFLTQQSNASSNNNS
jgi:flagellar hook-associated protein 2